ncbi:MAG TPA: TIGR03435 family protein [Vicinamibacterales bacterium]|nr:TIGR03435 family protein [Vicinamibacterales bacterium]
MARAFGISIVALILAIGSLRAQTPPAFDVTSVKPNTSGDDGVTMIPTPNGLSISNATLQMMMRLAYRVQDFQIIGAPDWLTTARFDVVGKAEKSVPQQTLATMLRALLVDRFKLAVHNATRELPVYALVRTRNDGTFGPQFKTPSECARPPQDQPATPPPVQPAAPTCANKVLPGTMSSRGATMVTLTVNLSVFVARTVIDRTGFAGRFDYDLRWTPDPTSPIRDNPDRATGDPNGPSLFTALEEQLGLSLESTKGPVDVLIIDHVEKPTPD